MEQYVGRKKSCAECRNSKARCSLGSPCRRCEERSLQCKYPYTPSRTSVRRLRPAIEARDREQHDGPRTADQWDARVETGIDLPAPEPEPDVMEGFARQAEPIGTTASIFQGLDSCVGIPMNWTSPIMPSSLSPPLGGDLASQTQPAEMSDLFGLSFLPGAHSPRVLQPNLPLTTIPRPNPATWDGCPPLNQERPSPAMLRVFYDKAPLAPRTSNTVATCFTARVLLGQLFTYPNMMGRGGKLPPFIFPPCAMDGLGPSAECCAPGYHQCLPEALAICSGLTRSFETRTSGNTSYLWKNIYSEVDRLTREVDFPSLCLIAPFSIFIFFLITAVLAAMVAY